MVKSFSAVAATIVSGISFRGTKPKLLFGVKKNRKTNKLFLTSTVSMILKYSVLYIFGKLGFGMNALIFSIITGIITTTFLVVFIVLNRTKFYTTKA